LDDAGDGFVLSDKFHHKVDGFARMIQKPYLAGIAAALASLRLK